MYGGTKRISLGEQFTPEIEEALRKTTFLVVVLSPNWLASKWCRIELDTFAKLHGPDGLRERVVLVNKRYIELDQRPPLLQGQLGFSFFERNTSLATLTISTAARSATSVIGTSSRRSRPIC